MKDGQVRNIKFHPVKGFVVLDFLRISFTGYMREREKRETNMSSLADWAYCEYFLVKQIFRHFHQVFKWFLYFVSIYA